MPSGLSFGGDLVWSEWSEVVTPFHPRSRQRAIFRTLEINQLFVAILTQALQVGKKLVSKAIQYSGARLTACTTDATLSAASFTGKGAHRTWNDITPSSFAKPGRSAAFDLC
jgi:hypothetical protein